MNEDILKKVGLKIGHYTNEKSLTGLTCFIAEEGTYIGIDVRGSSTGTINTSAYESKSAIELAHAVVLTGGSTFGLESSFGVMQYLEEQNIGNFFGVGFIPGIAGAVIYDLRIGNSKVRPRKEDGYHAAKNATFVDLSQGNIGVGTGATTGKWAAGKRMKGGFGIGITSLNDNILVAAFAVTNAVGDIVNPKTGKFYSESGQQNLVNNSIALEMKNLNGLISRQPTNTTLAVIATNMKLYRTQLMKVAEQAHNGMARAIYPVHTSLDGDVVFALSSLSGEQKVIPELQASSLVDLVGLAAADALVKAINNSIVHAKSIKGFPAYQG